METPAMQNRIERRRVRIGRQRKEIQALQRARYQPARETQSGAIDADGSKKTPVAVHRAICGSMERFISILIKHYAGNFPLWLAPIQAVVTTITSEGDEYAKVVASAARRAGLRVEIYVRNEKINYKVREHSLAKIPALLVVGKKEAETHFGFDTADGQRRAEDDADR
jgi:threonyl-tRNA synthetase